ncbi:hypothetical protein SORBI_3001G145550 [Sorghum bicolor]|uniref:Uncharacterized protein n=1 Tax=Sorghum bicolor TaxID=4558 RepID=A0A1Z5S5N8_SORBI|nr:hypothetical protein SORBI_3001G145550 [Sorghum bicolor]
MPISLLQLPSNVPCSSPLLGITLTAAPFLFFSPTYAEWSRRKQRRSVRRSRACMGGTALAEPPPGSFRKFLYIKVDFCNFLAKYFYTINFARAPKSFWLR